MPFLWAGRMISVPVFGESLSAIKWSPVREQGALLAALRMLGGSGCRLLPVRWP